VNFVSSKDIFESIVRREQSGPHGLNGFLLLMHIGAGPRRTDKLHERLGELIVRLKGREYEFVRVDELLAQK
jgi:peptidoglycan/xylan/chitin deacetylase (PgdA/CDA1 family)